MSTEGIRKLENGETKRPSNAVLARLAAVFGLSVDELTESNMIREPSASYEPLDPQLEQIQVNLKAIKRLNAKRIDELASTILAVKEQEERKQQHK